MITNSFWQERRTVPEWSSHRLYLKKLISSVRKGLQLQHTEAQVHCSALSQSAPEPKEAALAGRNRDCAVIG